MSTSTATQSPIQLPPPSPSHLLSLLTDSALPLSTFAFSSGLESRLSHPPLQPPNHSSTATQSPTPKDPFTLPTFLNTTLYSTSTLAVPFLLATHDNPTRASELNAQYTAQLLCPVQARASLSQGRALRKIYNESILPLLPPDASGQLRPKLTVQEGWHIPIIWAYVCHCCGISRRDAAWGFLWGVAKGVVSAAVRLAVCGPFVGQRVLVEIGGAVEAGVERGIKWEAEKGIGGCGMSWWGGEVVGGRQEILYSRVFNS
ncbi:hypothetical protein BJ508DRAFT_411350 [Ascobolus immersus RN42]|uniref:Urease accessory protein UreF n=1 Tax=Ascobolus immersus RN42 TaxID=1160509 RepID=A0A3N4IPN4_ASCIM|nr:hypothetical protein BJ508DRAFT_411350 [Ascobolus immersus RN42]